MLQVQLDEEEFGAVGARLEAAAATSDEGSEGVVGVRQDEARRRFIHPGDRAPTAWPWVTTVVTLRAVTRNSYYSGVAATPEGSHPLSSSVGVVFFRRECLLAPAT
jgi:hypothetical protein